MSSQPIIGLNMSMDVVDKYEKIGLLVPVSYVDAVAAAGGVPLCIPPCVDKAMMQRALQLLDGIVFIGGDDYRPEHYGGHPQPEDELMMERRDRFDMKLAKWVLEKTGLPVLGICGGHQLLSVALGGSLIQDIRTEWNPHGGDELLPHSSKERSEAQGVDYRHPVILARDTLISRVLRTPHDEMLMVNSTHHQAVNPERLGRFLRASAWSPDGVIEAIEPSGDSPWFRSGRFVLGIQWHPERMQDDEPHRNIFHALITAAQKK
jgi:putative glutamine amidotransferase